MIQSKSEVNSDKNQLEDLFVLAARQFQNGRVDQAKEMYQQILHDHPDHPRALHALGVMTFRTGNVAGAIKLIRRAIGIQPDFADAFNNLGNIFREQGQLEEALVNYQRAIFINPGHVLAQNNVGNILREQGYPDKAMVSYQRAITLNPEFADTYNGLASSLADMGRLDEAIACYMRTLEINPDCAEAHSNLGNLFMKQGKSQKAKFSYEKALALNPDFAEAYFNLGNWYVSRRKSSKAAASFIKAISKKLDYASAFNNLGNALKDQSRIEEAIEKYRMALRLNPGLGEARSNLLIAMHYSSSCTAESIYHESVAWQKECAGNIRRIGRFGGNPDPAKKLRIGYVSADFGRHPIGYFLSSVLASHDRIRIETYCYSHRTSEDYLSIKLKNSTDHWRCTVGINDDDLADIITADQIDILVDLSGHMGGNRLRVFARKPAPVQATWAGYVGTTGLSAIDYLITDRQETPPGSERWYVEKPIHLPECYVCYEPPVYAPEISALPALLNGYVTFGCFNNLAKLNSNVIALWSQVLQHVTDSRLMLITRELDDLDTRKSLAKEFRKFGVADRVILIGSLPHAELLSAYNRVDIALDPFPYSGGLTTLESLWMGVPVITLGGERFSSRHTLSHLTAVGLPEFIANGPEAYLASATSLAADLVKLTDLRRHLRARMAVSPLCDAIRFTRNLEAAFRQMWVTWCGTVNETMRDRQSCDTPFGDTAAGTHLSKSLDVALKCLEEGRVEIAESVYSRILSDNPDNPLALHGLALIAHCSGQGGQALTLLRRALEVQPDFAEAHDTLGNVLKEQGRIDEAIASYKAALVIKPAFAESLCNLGNVFMGMGRLEEALTSFQKALEAKADYAEASCNLGVVLADLGRLTEAVAYYQRAVMIKPDFALAHNNMGNALRELGKREEAVVSYRLAVRIETSFAEGYFNLGNALADLGELVEAVACYRKTVRLDPRFAEGYNNLGNTLKKQGLSGESVAVYRKALRIKPDFAEVHNNLGVALKEQGEIWEAVESFKQAIAFDPAFAEAYSNLGDVLRDMGRLDEAVASCRKALALKGDFSDAHNNLGNALNKQGKLAEALANYERALAIQPDSAMAYNNLSNALTAQGRLDESLMSYRQALAIKPDYTEAHSNLLFTMNYSPRCSAPQIFQESLRWNEIHAEPKATGRKPHPNNGDMGRRLRIGYVSPDFRRHSVSYFLEPLLAAHNRKEVEIYCYAEVIKPDEATFRMQAVADCWRSTVGITDEAVAERIRGDRIDILVDLAGHTAGNRLLVFAEKPAPVQVTWLGYPNTTGMSAMDYRLTDDVADPMELSDRFHTEALIRLPGGFLCYAPPSDCPPLNTLPATGNGYLTFGSFNNLAKTTAEVIDLWGRLLNCIVDSRLILKNNSFVDESARGRYLEMFREHGIDSSRITMLSMTATTRSHLELYGSIDITLDPFPYNGTTTTCEALWMGAPVVTLLGDRHSGRVGASILHQVGLDDLVAKTPEEYVRIAVELANDKKRLAILRRTLQQRMTSSPLCNAGNFAHMVEAAYRNMWQKWCKDSSLSINE